MATRRWSSKAIWMRSGWSSASIFWVFLFWGRFAVSQTIIPEAQEHFLTPSAHRDTHPFRWIGVYAKSKKRPRTPPLWRGATCGWRRKVFDCPQLIQIFRNSWSLYTIHSQTPSLMPLKMRKVQRRL